MLNPLNASSSLDEVVFANRNKAYGAYAIRKQYDTNILKSLFIVFAGFILLLLLSFTLRKPATPPVLVIPKQTIRVIDINLETFSPPAAAVAASQVASSSSANNLNYRVQADPLVNTDAPPAVNNISQPVTGPAGDVTGPVTGTNGNSQVDVIVDPAIPLSNEPLIFTDEMPLFNNGVGDIVSYLSKEINYPERALNANVSGKVLVVFDVAADGSVTNIRIERGIGFGCDEEAMRVVSKMPRWKPGLQNGKAVPVRMRLPIKFEMQ